MSIGKDFRSSYMYNINNVSIKQRKEILSESFSKSKGGSA